MKFKFLISLIAMTVFGFALSLYLPWWIIAPCCLSVALMMPLKPVLSFLAGFLSMFLHWGGLATWISLSNHHILTSKMGGLLFKTANPWIPVLLTAAIAGIIGGLAALVGSLLAYRKAPLGNE